MQPSINCQDGAIFTADAADLRRFASALVICSWTPPTATLSVLANAGVPVGCWRFTESPLAWPGFPADYVRRCPYAVFANEPDIEGAYPSWYADTYDAWAFAHGWLVEPAWSDEAKWQDDGHHYNVVTAHVYPRGLGAANLAACRARANGRPAWITEAGDATAPGQILVELAALGATDVPTWLYTFRALDQAAQPVYNLAGVALTAPPPPKGPTMRGIDVSSAQTALDWSAIAASGVAFAAIKATEGVGWPSPTFAAQWAGAGAANLTRIAYHFARPDLGNDPSAEAAYFVGVVGPLLRPGDLVALDIEVGSGDLSAWALAWLRAVETALGFRPLCYSYPSFIFAGLRDPALAAYPLWYASYQATEPPAPSPWRSYAIWQDDDAASVPGVGGLVDADVTWLSAADLRSLGKPAPDPAPTQEVDPVIQITPAIIAAAKDRYAALGIQPFEGGAIWKEFLARYAVGQANPTHNSILPSPALTPEVTPDATGDAYVLFDDGSIWVWRAAKGQVFTLEEKDRAATRALCGWAGRFA